MCLISAAQAQTGYTITTIAGNNTTGFSGDGGPATAAQLAGPISVTIDGSGNLYIADENNQRVRKVSGGNITTVVGNGTEGYSQDKTTATSAELATPNAVAVDHSGNLYVVDSLNFIVREVTGGTISTVAGNYLNLAPAFSGDGGLATNALLSFCTGVAVDSSGNIFISDNGNNRIRRVDAKTGNMSTFAGNGVVGTSGDGGAATLAHLNSPEGLAVDSAGNLYIADTDNNKVRMVNAQTGIITTVAGNTFGSGGFSGDGGQAVSGTVLLNKPQGVAVDAGGNIYIADRTNSRIRMVNAKTGIITTIAGNGRFAYTGDGGLATSAALNFPDDVAVDSVGNVYVADYGNAVIRMLAPPALPPAPGISAGGVVSASAFGGFSSIAPGSWIEIYGTNLAATTRNWASSDFTNNLAPTTLGQTTVTVAGQPAFIDYISPTQVNAQVPSNLPMGQQQIVVSTASGPGTPYNITVNATQPGMLAPPSFNINGKQYVAALFTDNATYVAPAGSIAGVTSRPAKPGDTIIIYGVGFGTVTGVPAGQIAPAGSLLATPPQISFGSTPATVSFAGLTPGSVGLYQFNVVVPNVAGADAVPLSFTLLGSSGSQTLYTAVQN